MASKKPAVVAKWISFTVFTFNAIVGLLDDEHAHDWWCWETSWRTLLLGSHLKSRPTRDHLSLISELYFALPSFCKFHNSMHFIHKPPIESIEHLAQRILSWPREGVHRFVYASRTSIFQLAAYAHHNTFDFLELSRAQWENQSTECQAVLDGASVSAPISMGENLIGKAIFGSANMCWGVEAYVHAVVWQWQ